jgi:hypothetical protein
MQIKIYDMETLEYAGSIEVTDSGWEYRDMKHDHMISVTKGMPLKAVMANLAAFGFVYDVIEDL